MHFPAVPRYDRRSCFLGNLLALYLFYEMLTFSTYPLVIHERGPDAMKAGAKYIIYNLSGAGAILIAIIETYSLAGKLDFTGGLFLRVYQRAGLTGCWHCLLSDSELKPR